MSKKQFIKIRESIIKLREELGTPQTQLVLYGFCVLLIVFVLIAAYRPLIIKLSNADRELKRFEAQLSTQRDSITTLKRLDLKYRLMQQKEVSQALDKITEKGRALGLKFISITPKELEKSANGNFKVLPIGFEIESTYQGLGQFLAYLEEFPHTTAEVKSLSVWSREKLLPKLNITVLVNLYMEAEDAK